MDVLSIRVEYGQIDPKYAVIEYFVLIRISVLPSRFDQLNSQGYETLCEGINGSVLC